MLYLCTMTNIPSKWPGKSNSPSGIQTLDAPTLGESGPLFLPPPAHPILWKTIYACGHSSLHVHNLSTSTANIQPKTIPWIQGYNYIKKKKKSTRQLTSVSKV